jgi:rhodanese-related sulfurtransferase/DNA-binding HxlR family transcriptional regulator
MSSQSPKQALYEQFAMVAKALAHGHRLELLELLAQGERGVEALAELGGLTIANASQHLQQLRRAGLVATRKDGTRVFYRLADDAVVTLMAALRQIAARNVGEVQRVLAGYVRERDSFEPVSKEDLVRRMRKRAVTLIDVRPPEEFAAGHIPSAVNIPLRNLAQRLSELPRGKEIIAYCRGPYCVLSYEAAAELRKRGFKARRLAEGYPEWRAAGLPVEGPSANA